METPYFIFPASQKWPQALDDVAKAPLESTSIRLISGAHNFDEFPSYKSLKNLWCFDIDEKKLSSICECNSLESFFVENIKTDNLGCIKQLSNLRILGVESCSKATTLDAFAKLHSLSGLAITNFKNVHSLEPLADLSNLRALAVAGSMWTKMQVKSFKPLEKLTNLELLHLTNIQAEDESLKPLSELRNLKQLDIANFYPMSEFAWLSQKLKTTKCTWFQPYIEMKHIAGCKKCNEATMVLLTGKRKKTICRQCDKKMLTKHVQEWNELTSGT